MVDTRQLRAKMYLEGLTMRDVAQQMKISTSALYRKYNLNKFTLKDCESLIKILHIKNPLDIFFKDEVS